MSTFAELYCAHYGVPPDRFASSMFWRCLHRRAWPFVIVLRVFSRGYFVPDEELVRDVGRLTRAAGLTEDLADFNSHSLNVGFLRRRLRMRISVGRVTKEVHRLLPGRAAAAFYDVSKLHDADDRPASPLSDKPPHSASS